MKRSPLLTHAFAGWILLVSLSGCASEYPRSYNALGGIMAGATAGGVAGAGTGNPESVAGGILIGAVVGGVAGLIWPTDKGW